ncbi:hypothetical protein E1263_21400 [Kribbella antibiotica]|uniref:Nucleotidyltransferase domain-containing protein n=1 Tax=Kribbella antibiotica TaxID=190195 RepID=A0A4R4ZH22_9ACTN|nr:hypothetical protein [Kribbella antibiotica]TDD57931.1 hypothetical protein E1263_21400 [Kribbella antibiotica]
MSLADRAHTLQSEAHQLFTELDLGTAFPWPPTLIGSARSGLMATRDLDVMFDAPDATGPTVLSGLTTLAQRVQLESIDFRDERADRRPTPAITDERYYAVLHTATWKIDLTFWLHVVDRPHVEYAERVAAATDEQRLTILRLKESGLDSTMIYNAVLDL